MQDKDLPDNNWEDLQTEHLVEGETVKEIKVKPDYEVNQDQDDQ